MWMQPCAVARADYLSWSLCMALEGTERAQAHQLGQLAQSPRSSETRRGPPQPPHAGCTKSSTCAKDALGLFLASALVLKGHSHGKGHRDRSCRIPRPCLTAHELVICVARLQVWMTMRTRMVGLGTKGGTLTQAWNRRLWTAWAIAKVNFHALIADLEAGCAIAAANWQPSW
jgi:hypothetical protein